MARDSLSVLAGGRSLERRGVQGRTVAGAKREGGAQGLELHGRGE